MILQFAPLHAFHKTPSCKSDNPCRFVEEPSLSAEMGVQGAAHVKKRFSFTAFTETISEAVTELTI